MPSVSLLWAGGLIAVFTVPCLLAGVGTGTPWAGVLVGLLGAVMLYGHWRWAAARPRIPRRPPMPPRRRGFTLLSAVVSLTVITVAMGVCVQVLVTASRATAAAEARAQALAKAVSALEAATAAGADAGRLAPAAAVAVTRRPGPVEHTATVRAQATVGDQTVVLWTVVVTEGARDR